MPWPWGGSPISAAVDVSTPVVMNRSSPFPDSSMTPSAPYCASVRRVAVSTSFCSSDSSESSEASATVASSSSRRRPSAVRVSTRPTLQTRGLRDHRLLALDDEHRDGGVMEDVGRDASVEQAAEPAPAVGAENDQPGPTVLRRLADLLAGESVEDDRARPDPELLGAVLDPLRDLCNAVLLDLAHAGDDLGVAVVPGGRCLVVADADDDERRVECEGELDRLVGRGL